MMGLSTLDSSDALSLVPPPTSSTQSEVTTEENHDSHAINSPATRKNARLQADKALDSPAKPQPEEYSIIATGTRKSAKKAIPPDDLEPLIDTTAALTLNSKKTKRAQKQLQRRQEKAAKRQKPTSLLDLPPELLVEVIAHLLPSDLFALLRVNRTVKNFVEQQENSIINDIVRRRYWVLSRCFPVPVPFDRVDESAKPALLSEARQKMLIIHKKPYQHVQQVDEQKICTCISCVYAWNNLNLILDLAHWQKNMNSRQPITQIPRGTNPEWNQNLLKHHSTIVDKAIKSRLAYAAILEKHLKTTVNTMLRTIRSQKKIQPYRIYYFVKSDAAEGTDEFLERSGPPSYEFPYHRDVYYSLEAYVPNRKWSREKQEWIYYAADLHRRDIEWVKERFTPLTDPVSPLAKIKSEYHAGLLVSKPN